MPTILLWPNIMLQVAVSPATYCLVYVATIISWWVRQMRLSVKYQKIAFTNIFQVPEALPNELDALP